MAHAFLVHWHRASSRDSPLDRFRNTQWRLNHSNVYQVDLEFDARGATQTLTYSPEPQTTRATSLSYQGPEWSSGLHEGQASILGWDDEGSNVLLYYVSGEDCLLLPQTEAPGDCLKPLEKR